MFKYVKIITFVAFLFIPVSMCCGNEYFVRNLGIIKKQLKELIIQNPNVQKSGDWEKLIVHKLKYSMSAVPGPFLDKALLEIDGIYTTSGRFGLLSSWMDKITRETNLNFQKTLRGEISSEGPVGFPFLVDFSQISGLNILNEFIVTWTYEDKFLFRKFYNLKDYSALKNLLNQKLPSNYNVLIRNNPFKHLVSREYLINRTIELVRLETEISYMVDIYILLESKSLLPQDLLLKIDSFSLKDFQVLLSSNFRQVALEKLFNDRRLMVPVFYLNHIESLSMPSFLNGFKIGKRPNRSDLATKYKIKLDTDAYSSFNSMVDAINFMARRKHELFYDFDESAVLKRALSNPSYSSHLQAAIIEYIHLSGFLDTRFKDLIGHTLENNEHTIVKMWCLHALGDMGKVDPVLQSFIVPYLFDNKQDLVEEALDALIKIRPTNIEILKEIHDKNPEILVMIGFSPLEIEEIKNTNIFKNNICTFIKKFF